MQINSEIIDPQQLSNGPEELTRELYALLAEELPKAKMLINTAINQNDFKKASDELHRLLGSCAYCGLIRLSPIVAKLYDSLKENRYPSDLLDSLNQEIDAVMGELKQLGFV